ncbi:IPTL-CTERM sorting domain-containing protein [Elongatibacter sediminis]|uniref:IPTL-CTERM sorting domain-containing protein n=1 Tax=Elongatibacter sediminis TaxID=3119006 RepID=A0AAW9RCL6_9GAMM
MSRYPAAGRLMLMAVLIALTGQVFAQSVLIANTNDNDHAPLAAALSGLFPTVDNFEMNDDGSLTSGVLAPYDAVIAYTNSALDDSAGAGDALADYVDAGGCMVLATYGMSTPWEIAGRIATTGYSPLVNVGSNGTVSGNLNALVPADPVFAGVNFGTLTYDNNPNFAHPDLDTGATLLADDGAGINMIARNASGNVLAMNLFPEDDADNNNDLYRLFVNAAAECAGGIQASSRASFSVEKDFSDDNPGEVDVTISCNTGLPLEQTKTISEGEGVQFIVTDYDDGELDCTITESVPAGYEVEYDDGSSVSADSCQYENVAFGQGFSCDITNTPAPVDIVIEKEWVFEGSTGPEGVDTDYWLTLWCDAEIVNGVDTGDFVEAPAVPGPKGPGGCGLVQPTQESGQFIGNYHNWCQSFYGDSSAVFNAQVIPEYPDSHCYVTESVFDGAVEVDNGCDDLTVSAGQGASCTITNSVFYEGIPTLSQYGMAILALLMLGMGLVGFRRFA